MVANNGPSCDLVRWLMALLACIVVGSCMVSSTYALSTGSAGGSTSASVNNCAPIINCSSYSMNITTLQGFLVYEYSQTGGVTPSLFRSNALVPYAFTGEGITFEVNVSDLNGESDLVGGDVMVILVDASNPYSTMSIHMGFDDATQGDADTTSLRYHTQWTVPNVYGLYNVTIYAHDKNGANAVPNNIYKGQIFLNPMVGINITGNNTGTPTPFTGLSFGSVNPGQKNVPANENKITIHNTDPDNVGMQLAVAASATSLNSINAGQLIPASCLHANITKANGNPFIPPIYRQFQNNARILLWQPLKPCMANALEMDVYLDVPSPLAPGSYSGSMSIYGLGL